MRQRLFLSIFLAFLFSQFTLSAQTKDTLKVMSYNLLNYRNNSIPGCSNTNNNPTTKESDLETIIDYVLPDILVCNEIGTSDPAASFRISSNALNQNGRNYYRFTTMQKGQRQNINSSSTGNMIFWDSRKLELHSSQYLEFDPFNRALVRVIDLFTLYYKDPNLAVHTDTVFLHLFVAHLKAGNTSSDRNEREWATDAVMAYLDSNNLNGNYMIAGDFNVYNASENAYQNLINYPDSLLRFYDPINVAGNWSNNSPFAIVHTQSTRTTSGCGASGGMDDRFDFILASDEVMNGTDSVEYISNTYEALGQDGQRFNGSLTGSPTNNSAPSSVLQAMEALSDHLPVVMDVEVRLPMLTSIQEKTAALKFSFNNPVDQFLQLNYSSFEELKLVEILDMSGRVVKSFNQFSSQYSRFDCSDLTGGIYFIRLTNKEQDRSTQKLIKI